MQNKPLNFMHSAENFLGGQGCGALSYPDISGWIGGHYLSYFFQSRQFQAFFCKVQGLKIVFLIGNSNAESKGRGGSCIVLHRQHSKSINTQCFYPGEGREIRPFFGNFVLEMKNLKKKKSSALFF